MRVRDGMTTGFLTVGPSHTLRQAAARMADRNVGSAVVIDPEAGGPGIITERDVLRSVARGEDPGAEVVSDHLTADSVTAAPDWSLEEAADAMRRGGFRHLVVVDGGEAIGVLSMRDIVAVWSGAGHGASPAAAS